MFLKILLIISSFAFSLASQGSGVDRTEQIAREVAEWFNYTRGPMNSEHLGQCSDYALRFVLKYNEFVGKNVARLVVANNPIQSGVYRVEEKIDIAQLEIPGFDWKTSGFVLWNEQTYLFHPLIGTYRIVLEKAWTPKSHFGVNMLDPSQVHVWSSVHNLSVDPTYFDLWPDQFPSPLGSDEFVGK